MSNCDIYYADFPIDKLSENVLQREPLRGDEKIVACYNAAILRPWKSGLILTDQSLIEWSKKKVRRYDTSKMIGITSSVIVEGASMWLKFKYDGKPTKVVIPVLDGFFNIVCKYLPQHEMNTEMGSMLEVLSGDKPGKIRSTASRPVIPAEAPMNRTLQRALRILSWPFLFMGGIGLGRYLVPILLTSDYDEALKDMGGASYGHWLLMIGIAGVVFAIGLLLRWLTRAR